MDLKYSLLPFLPKEINAIIADYSLFNVHQFIRDYNVKNKNGIVEELSNNFNDYILQHVIMEDNDIIAGGAVSNFLLYHLGVSKKLVIKDIDLFHILGYEKTISLGDQFDYLSSQNYQFKLEKNGIVEKINIYLYNEFAGGDNWPHVIEYKAKLPNFSCKKSILKFLNTFDLSCCKVAWNKFHGFIISPDFISQTLLQSKVTNEMDLSLCSYVRAIIKSNSLGLYFPDDILLNYTKHRYYYHQNIHYYKDIFYITFKFKTHGLTLERLHSFNEVKEKDNISKKYSCYKCSKMGRYICLINKIECCEKNFYLSCKCKIRNLHVSCFKCALLESFSRINGYFLFGFIEQLYKFQNVMILKNL